MARNIDRELRAAAARTMTSLPILTPQRISTPSSRIRCISASITAPRQAVLRDAVPQHAARLGEGLRRPSPRSRGARADRRTRAPPGPRRSRRPSRRTARRRRGFGSARLLSIPQSPMVALDRVDRHRPVLLLAIALLLARVRADPPHDRRERRRLDLDVPGARAIASSRLTSRASRAGDRRQPAADVVAARAVWMQGGASRPAPGAATRPAPAPLPPRRSEWLLGACLLEQSHDSSLASRWCADRSGGRGTACFLNFSSSPSSLSCFCSSVGR